MFDTDAPSSLHMFLVCFQLEALDCVERAFVHCDYQHRDEPEHKVERLLQGLMPPLLEVV